MGINSRFDCAANLCVVDYREFLISSLRCDLKNGSAGDNMPTWGGFHAPLSTGTVPLMRVGFMPVIPSPFTDCATMHKGLQNLQSILRQLNPSQLLIPVFCDKGIFHTVADITMAQLNEFSDIHGMMGIFHWMKILLKCAGHYLRESGIADGFIETQVFGKLTLNSVLEGSHYTHSFNGIMVVSELLSSLA